jgi:hypothetical protein
MQRWGKHAKFAMSIVLAGYPVMRKRKKYRCGNIMVGLGILVALAAGCSSRYTVPAAKYDAYP